MTELPPRGSSLPVIQDYVKTVLEERGFSDETLAQRFMLFLEEAGEFAKAARKTAGIKVADNARQQDLADEAADVLILLLDICIDLNIDLETAFFAKETKNRTRNWK
jgi:NTP pyrophosphatase (non-canonical NTP hydrolase)